MREVGSEGEVFRNNLCRFFQLDIGGLGLDSGKFLRRETLGIARNGLAHRLLDAIEQRVEASAEEGVEIVCAQCRRLDDVGLHDLIETTGRDPCVFLET
jgi:hypothetical protein